MRSAWSSRTHTFLRPQLLVASNSPQRAVLLKTPVSLPSRSRSRLVQPTNFSIPPNKQDMGEKFKVLVFGAGNFGSCLADHLGDSAHDVFMWSRSKKVVDYFNTHHRNPDFLKDHVFPDTIQAVGPDFPSTEMVRGMDVLLFAIPTQGVSYTGDDPIGVELAGALKNVYAIAAGMADGLGFENNTRANQDVAERAKDLMALPAIRELDLPSAGKPAHLLMKKLGIDV
ncbi:hypothetical protein PHLCEN_2v8318 [Hermanssonia centrifuga]|uniref:glycerol-3-phosphate dehydrogenase (NAD(+)) n=1 Tax=Hermanssonia centrifuga TaxID=98765 RepID=A0A2R6NU70_9APHY|nr:hypothetical protein PHLCEN_2v8318 [Hermanssonia centrifuga]